jgi:hypothetical protein
MNFLFEHVARNILGQPHILPRAEAPAGGVQWPAKRRETEMVRSDLVFWGR